jgi:Omp85 superfamily domain
MDADRALWRRPAPNRKSWHLGWRDAIGAASGMLLLAVAASPGAARADAAAPPATATSPATQAATPAEAATAQDPGATTKREKAKPKKKKKGLIPGVDIVAVPIPLSDPALGSGVAPVGMFLYTPPGSDGPWTTGVGGLFTSTKSYALGFLQKARLNGDQFRLTAFAGYGSFNLKFFGVGGELASQDRSIEINQRGEVAVLEGLVRVAPHLYFGPRYLLINLNTTLPVIKVRDITIPLPQLKSASSELGPAGVYDTRDTEYGPRRGIYITGQWLFSEPALGSKFQYDKLTLDANMYVPISASGVLAARVSFCAAGQDAPIYDLCLYGSRNDLRGYATGQYRDHDMAAAQVELRQHLFWKIGAVAFAGGGGIAPGADSRNPFAKATFLPDAGVGVRFMASEDYRVNLSVDYAVGKHSNGLYIYVGEAF